MEKGIVPLPVDRKSSTVQMVVTSAKTHVKSEVKKRIENVKFPEGNKKEK
jgi:hypothetical protein